MVRFAMGSAEQWVMFVIISLSHKTIISIAGEAELESGEGSGEDEGSSDGQAEQTIGCALTREKKKHKARQKMSSKRVNVSQGISAIVKSMKLLHCRHSG